MLSRIKNHKGFTLIELMIVVAIIGILAAIAIPNFLRFQAKSKQAEAKTNLGAIGTTAEAYRTEFDSYCADFNDLGWAAQGNTRYAYYYSDCTVVDEIVAVVTPSGGATLAAPACTATTVTQFTAGASGDIDKDTTEDDWCYADTRELWNALNDVSQ